MEDDVSIEELRKAVEHMHSVHVLRMALPIAMLLWGCGQANDTADAATNPTCHKSGGLWDCPGNSPSRACPAGAACGGPCDDDGGGCFYCSEGVILGAVCVHSDGGDEDAAPFYGLPAVWSDCIGGGIACQQ